MKLKYGVILLALVAGAIIWPVQQAISQDTLVVAWSKDGTYPTIDTLRNFIYGDTTATGDRKNLNRVYKLQKGGIYWLANRIENSQKDIPFPLRLVGEAPGTTYEQNPPIIQLVAATGNPDSRMITGLADVTLKNLYLSGRWGDGTQGSSYQWITMTANNSTYIVDNCILEQSDFAPIAFTGKYNKIYCTNNKLRNLVQRPITQQWTGRGCSIWADQDTVIFENNTFFNVGCFAIQIEGGSAKYVRFNHNTIVLCGRQIGQGNWWQEGYIANNLIVNGFWEGESQADLTSTGRDPRQTHNGFFQIGALPSAYAPEQWRRVVIAKNYAFLDPRFTTRYATDNVQRAYFVDPITILDYLNVYNVGGAAGGHMYCRDTVWLSSYPAGMFDPLNDPDWQKPRRNVTGATMIDSMWAAIRMIRDNQTASGEQYQYAYKQNIAWTDYTWPLPEDFTYTDANLVGKGTDGLNIGDLNWFPSQKATFLANKDKYVADIQNLAGGVVVFKVDTTVQAEAGTPSGTAAARNVAGFAYYRFESGGDIKWSFNLASAVPDCKLVVYTNLTGQNPRGEYIKVNGTNLRNNSGYGEYYFTSPPLKLDGWDSVTITKADLIEGASGLDLPAGTNSVEIQKSWGWQNFSGFSIYNASGSLVVKQEIPEAVLLDGGLLTSEGAKWAPSGLRYVSLGTSGTITWNLNASVAGSYVLRVFYQNPGSSQTVQIKADGATVVAAFDLPGKADSTGIDALSGAFSLSAGSHSIALTGGNVNVDYIQLINQTVSSVKQTSDLPQGFALAQNYPNPFNPTTTINFSLGKTSYVELTVYNILGQKVATLLDSHHMNVGTYAVQFDARNFASGVYVYRLQAGDFRSDKKMLLLK
jgi:hypothetical protein